MRPRLLLLGSVAITLALILLPRQCGRGEGTGTRPVDLPAFTPQRETAVLRFVDEHHPELRSVLERVKNLNRQQYEQAIRQLFQESDKLALVKASDEKLYEIMLESWQVKSRSDVLAARLACTKEGRDGLEKELKELLYRQVDLHRLQIEHNRQRTLAALKVMETNIKLLHDKRDEIAERRFRNLTGRKPAP